MEAVSDSREHSGGLLMRRRQDGFARSGDYPLMPMVWQGGNNDMRTMTEQTLIDRILEAVSVVEKQCKYIRFEIEVSDKKNRKVLLNSLGELRWMSPDVDQRITTLANYYKFSDCSGSEQNKKGD